MGDAPTYGDAYVGQMEETVLLKSLLRALLIAFILIASLSVAMFVGMLLADTGMLGTCQDGACQLVAAVYVMPLGGVGLYVAILIAYSVVVLRRGRSED